MTKRKRSVVQTHAVNKRQKCSSQSFLSAARSVQHAVLKLYYPRLYPLGEFLKAKLPSSSRHRRRKLELFDELFPQHHAFLDQILVGVASEVTDGAQHARRDELVNFTQTQRSNRGSHDQGSCNWGEVLDFVVWLLFRRDLTTKTPSHLLCHGFQRSTSRLPEAEQAQSIRLPGIIQRNENTNLNLLRNSPWTHIANILGDYAELIGLHLLLDCGVFQRLQAGKDNLYQLSGEPIPSCEINASDRLASSAEPKHLGTSSRSVQPGSIQFARSRILYARAPLNGAAKVQLGLNHLHALNRQNGIAQSERTIRMLQHVFPRQFDLPNVFVPTTKSNEKLHLSSKDLMRNDETAHSMNTGSKNIPRRLRGLATNLVQKLCHNHTKCSYTQMLRHHCPLPGFTKPVLVSQPVESPPTCVNTALFLTQPNHHIQDLAEQAAPEPKSDTSFISYATPVHQVSAFCRAMIHKLLPGDFLGTNQIGHKNWRHLLHSIDRFVQMRRYETMTLHEVGQGISLKGLGWLCPCWSRETDKMSSSDRAKRLELLYESLYYVFNSLLILLIRSNFYVTETAVHRNRLFYFRQDVWKRLSDPSLASLKMSMFQPLRSRQIQHGFNTHSLGCSQMRLLPKEHGVRPIMNLKKRSIKFANGRRVLSAGINTQLLPVFGVLNLIRQEKPEILASAMFSVGEIQNRLKGFKAHFGDSHHGDLYFVKVDIQSCFDTIPQRELLSYIQTLTTATSYRATKYVEVKRAPKLDACEPEQVVKKYVNRAAHAEESLFSPNIAEAAAGSKRRSVFVGLDQAKEIKLTQVQNLLAEHLTQNIVRIGRKHFKQIEGIPQGSILSSLLCSFFYGEFERNKLGFLDSKSSLLLRLIDDFLLITSDKGQAREFVKAMSGDNTSYGITINAGKSLANFEMNVNGHRIPRMHGGFQFPYCGMNIDTRTLQISKDRQRKDANVANGLTADENGKAGVKFQRRILASFKLQMHAGLLDRSLNSRAVALRSLFECFVETGMKMHRYRSSLSRTKQPSQTYLVELCRQLIDLAFKMSHRLDSQDRMLVTRSQMSWLAATALVHVLAPKQSAYPQVLAWLQKTIDQSQRSMSLSNQELRDIASKSVRLFEHYVY